MLLFINSSIICCQNLFLLCSNFCSVQRRNSMCISTHFHAHVRLIRHLNMDLNSNCIRHKDGLEVIQELSVQAQNQMVQQGHICLKRSTKLLLYKLEGVIQEDMARSLQIQQKDGVPIRSSLIREVVTRRGFNPNKRISISNSKFDCFRVKLQFSA